MKKTAKAKAAKVSNTTNASGVSEDTKTIVTVLLLIFFMPVGFILMWFWTKWKVWVKLLVTLLFTPVFLFLAGIVAAATLLTVNPGEQMKKANCMKSCEIVTEEEKPMCLSKCLNIEIPTPEDLPLPE